MSEEAVETRDETEPQPDDGAQHGDAPEQDAPTGEGKSKKKKQSAFMKKHGKLVKRIALILLVLIVIGVIAGIAAYKIPVLDQRGGTAAEYDIAEAGSWTDGTYTKQVDGKRRFSVTVTIEGGYMTDIDVSDNNETPGKGAVALPLLAEEALEAQSPDVPDVMTGVTLSTVAFKDAVYRCLEEASK